MSLPTEPSCFGSDGYYSCSTHCICKIQNYPITVSIDIVALVLLLALIIGFAISKDLRRRPGDLVLALAFSQLLYSASWLFQNPEEEDGNCNPWVSYVSYLSKVLTFNYTVAFFLYVAFSLSKSIKSNLASTLPYHIVSLVLAIINFFFRLDDLGQNIYGYCAERTSSTYYYSALVLAVFVVFPILTMVLTYKYTPKNQKITNMRDKFLKYYSFFLLVNAIVYVATSIFDFLILSDLLQYANYNNDYIANEDYVTIGLILRTSVPIVVVLARFFDPTIRHNLKKMLTKEKDDDLIIPKREKKPKKGRDNRTDLNTSRSMNVSMVLMPKRDSEDTVEIEDDNDMLGKFRESFKVQMIYTILASIHFHSYQTAKVKKPKFLNYTDEEENLRLPISKDLIGDEKPELLQEIEKKQYGLLTGLLTVYAPMKFETVITMDSSREAITESLNLEKNFSNIIRSGVNGGGKSGEFFFFSQDNSMIIKTITDHELHILLQILPGYITHLKANKRTMLAKIYGAYTIETENPYERYNIILMKNVSGYPKHCIRRIFDLKGSTFGRAEIKDLSIRKEEIKVGKILKDLDFDRFEGQLHIENDMKGALSEALTADAEFLRKYSLIDYSLIVIKIEHFLATNNNIEKTFNREFKRSHTETSQDLSDSNKPIDNRRGRSETGAAQKAFLNPLSAIKSTKEELHYHIGIIDYLNDYSFRKKMEVFSRKLINCNPKLDLSVQHPDFYSERFIRYTKKIIFG